MAANIPPASFAQLAASFSRFPPRLRRSYASVRFPSPSSQFLLRTFLITIILFVPSRLRAQAYFGTVSGVLMDASGAVVEGASVMLSAEPDVEGGPGEPDHRSGSAGREHPDRGCGDGSIRKRFRLPGPAGRCGLLGNLTGIWFLLWGWIRGESGDCGHAGLRHSRPLRRNGPHNCCFSQPRTDLTRPCDKA